MKFVHRFSDEEISNLLGNSVSDISHHNRVVVVDTGPQFFNETFFVFLLDRLLLRCAWVLWLRISGFSYSLWGRISNYAGAEFFVVEVVGKEVTLLSINN